MEQSTVECLELARVLKYQDITELISDGAEMIEILDVALYLEDEADGAYQVNYAGEYQGIISDEELGKYAKICRARAKRMHYAA